MDSVIESANQARTVAKAVLTERYPGTDEWFDIAWEHFSAVPQEKRTAGEAAEAILGITGKSDPATRELAKELAILFQALMEKFPAVEEEVMARLEARCKEAGKSPGATKVIATSIREKFSKLPEETFCVWMIEPNTLGSRERPFSRTELEKEILPLQSSFGIFVYHRSVYLNGSTAPLKLEDRYYRLLLMLLRYKDEPLPIIPSCRKAFPKAQIYETYTEEDLVSQYLKEAVAGLRDKLAMVSGLEIPKKDRGAGYLCRGDFRACVIIPASQKEEFTLAAHE